MLIQDEVESTWQGQWKIGREGRSESKDSMQLAQLHTHTHTHTRVCVCVCVCVYNLQRREMVTCTCLRIEDPILFRLHPGF